MANSTRFALGSGCYSCRICTRLTRDDGQGDSCEVGLCSQCYELCGMQNQMNDGGTLIR